MERVAEERKESLIKWGETREEVDRKSLRNV